MNLNVTELDSGSWVILELPGFTTVASGAEQSSLDALRKASATSYYKGKDALWLKVVSTGDPGTGDPSTGFAAKIRSPPAGAAGDARSWSWREGSRRDRRLRHL